MPSASASTSYAQTLEHDLGPKCRLAPVVRPFTPSPPEAEAVPPVNAHYFYISPIPIDDPLSTVTIAGSSDAKLANFKPRPFSEGDNNALEKAWLGLASADYRRNHSQARRNRSPSPSLAKINAERLQEIIQDLAVKHKEKHAREGPGHQVTPAHVDTLPEAETALPLCCQEVLADVGVQLRTSFCAVARKRQRALNRERVAQEVMAEMETLKTDSTATVTVAEQHKSGLNASTSRRRGGSFAGVAFQPSSFKDSSHTPLERIPRSDSRPSSRRGVDTASRQSSHARAQSLRTNPSSLNEGTPIPVRAGGQGDGITGKPFVRVGTPDMVEFPISGSLPSDKGDVKPAEEKSAPDVRDTRRPVPEMPSTLPERGRRRSRQDTANVPVGVSRLHEVSLPALQMKPIYWSPVNDIAAVLRATWFYKDNMEPIDPAVANQLEAGYQELKPYTDTWNVELRCAIEVGPLGEEKVSHPLWPKALDSKAKTKEKEVIQEPTISNNPFCAARCFKGEAAAQGNLLPSSHEDNSSEIQSHRKYDQYHVIYKDENHAYLLKPSLRPSAYYGRRPVAKIMKSLDIGIPVVRGFDRAAYDKIHVKKIGSQKAAAARSAASESQESTGQNVCMACKREKERAQVTDLILVAHGIGQKLAERVESYHFTYAINTFRRMINVELGSDAVKEVLRDGQNGIMVLPVNWRQNLSFEEGGPMREGDKAEYMPEGFGLKDIEPKTIPAVRGMISDIMFDIPFYMSHHKPKMISALVGEANRVYRLWCRNNPGFAGNGRLHLIGHSLGSAMALEILSKQPTITPHLRLESDIRLDRFEFDVKNLFLLGSPAAFFLLLERGALIPRKGRQKPGAETADADSEGVVGEAGLFGCLAVDNVYNVLAREDPVAYLLNGTIDPKYSASLKTAYVPSSTMTFFQSMGNAMRSMVPGASSSTAHAAENSALIKPPTMRLPSQLELEVHDFTREDIAEKKAFLLNDNGQIDYFLRSGGGPLEIQYLNMLGAHSSYWANPDLIRMLCMEIGRKPGRAHTLPAMRAAKVGKRALPSTPA
ncbi:DDHD domain-containing protein [Truncatella angustata]|uniref:DDHD domain-containing protein n=1 Tax=Truncatella angustata TaxID=152316 RepID=A0A9P8UPX7_9PEZI|nr:DDHD domain-containing protein [Truncatella angustata]KAH6656204.1 DDHD domain-containing protein [Truncatella angustata]